MEPREEGRLDKALRLVARLQIRNSFMPEHAPQATEEEGLGIALAHHFKWDGLSILRTFYAALEDANFHAENETVADWIKEIEHA